MDDGLTTYVDDELVDNHEYDDSAAGDHENINGSYGNPTSPLGWMV